MKRLGILSALCVLILAACQPIVTQPAEPAPPAVSVPAVEEPTTDAMGAAPAVSAPSTKERIVNATSAAPTVIGKDATILDWPTEAGGPMVVLREGTNGWICITDWAVSPGNDPMCVDSMFAKWNDALGAGAPLTVDRPGVAYMLAGGSDPSNTDPFAMEPATGEEWISTPPHLMLLAPGGFDPADFSNTPKQDEPYIMWDGTPYEHLMMPVVPISQDAMGDASIEMQSAMSSAPLAIASNATVMGNPTSEGGDIVVLQKGVNGWTCYPDRAVSPGNDPSCYNPTMDAAFAAMDDAKVTKPGLGYMLQGGSDESNFDMRATGPAPGEDWITTPPHVMFMAPGGFDTGHFTTDHMSGYPYIMFDGTPIEHIMIPVTDMAMGQ